MKTKMFKLYSLAKNTSHEILMEAQLQSAGANQARLLERFEKNKNAIRNQQIAVKIVFMFMFSFLSLLPLLTYFQLIDVILNTSIEINSILFTTSILFGMFFTIMLLYLLLIGMLNASAMMSGVGFRWLETMPIDRNSLQKLSFLTIFRSIDLPLLSIIVAFPVIMLIGTQNWMIFFICIGISILDVIFSFSILVLVGEKMNRIMNVSESNSKRATTIRLITMLSYIIISFGTSAIIQWSFSSIYTMFILTSSLQNSQIINIILSLIPFPFGITFLLSLFITPASVPFELWISTGIGFGLFLILTFFVYKSSIRALRSITSSKSEEIKGKSSRASRDEEIIIEIESITPVKAYIRKDLLTATREIQTLMFIIMPFILPIITTIPMVSGFGELFTIPSEGFYVFWGIMWIYVPMISIMLTSGLSGMEESGSTILASLPLNPRDQAKAKLFLMIAIQTGSYLMPMFFLLTNPGFLTLVLLFLTTLPLVWVFLLLFFEMKIRLFGRLRYKYVVEEVNPERKVLKYFFMILLEYILCLVMVLVMIVLMLTRGLIIMVISLSIISLALLLGEYLIFNRMFPKTPGKYEHLIVGFRERMRKTPFIGISILLLLYSLFLFLPDFIELPIIFALRELPYVSILFVDFFITFGVIAVLWLVIVPFGLRLPNGKLSFAEYSKVIHLSTVRPLLRNIFLGISCSIITWLCMLFSALIFGRYEFNLNILFGAPSADTGALGWFIFVTMLIPGIWEEISFRGVMLPMLLRKYSQKRSIVINGVVFGLYHLLNLVVMIFIGAPIILTFIQVIYASCLGFVFAYIYTKTNSLLPSIIIHYLINSIGQLFLNVYIDDLLSLALFLIIGIGVAPMFINMVLAKFITQRENKTMR